MESLDLRKKQIGMIRYADVYHPSNEASAAHLSELLSKLGREASGTPIISRQMRGSANKLARALGYQIHWFEKGLGR